MKNETKQSILSKKFPKAATINKKLVILLAGLAGLLILLALMSALKPRAKQVARVNPLQVANNATQIEPTVAKLPSYSDAATIKKILGEEPPTVVHQPSPEIKAEMDALKQQGQQLETELSALRKLKATPPKPVLTPEDNNAYGSSIFFNSGQPRQQPTELNKTQNQVTNAKTPAKNYESESDQNGQQDKLNFINGENSADTLNKESMQPLQSPNMIFQGTYIPVTLLNAVNSDLPGNVMAKVRANVYDSVTGLRLLIPVGSTLFGQYNSQVSYGQKSIQMVFTRLVRPDGSSIVLSNAQGVSDEGTSGINGTVNNHWGGVITSALLTAAFSLPQAFVNSNQSSSPTIIINNPSGKQEDTNKFGSRAGSAAAQAGASGVSQVGSNIASRSLNRQPTIEIPSGKLFTIQVAKDLIIPPYTGEVVK